MEYVKNVDEEDEKKAVESLIKYDQLKECKKYIGWLSNFEEMDITFMPTYKYEVGTKKYDLSSKKRVPSW
jgi:hypothetical protein